MVGGVGRQPVGGLVAHGGGGMRCETSGEEGKDWLLPLRSAATIRTLRKQDTRNRGGTTAAYIRPSTQWQQTRQTSSTDCSDSATATESERSDRAVCSVESITATTVARCGRRVRRCVVADEAEHGGSTTAR